MDDKPNVTVIYQQAPSRTATFGAVLVELLFTLILIGVGLLLAALMR